MHLNDGILRWHFRTTFHPQWRHLRFLLVITFIIYSEWQNVPVWCVWVAKNWWRKVPIARAMLITTAVSKIAASHRGINCKFKQLSVWFESQSYRGWIIHHVGLLDCWTIFRPSAQTLFLLFPLSPNTRWLHTCTSRLTLF